MQLDEAEIKFPQQAVIELCIHCEKNIHMFTCITTSHTYREIGIKPQILT